MSQSPQALTDIVVPENFTPYIQQLTEEKARLVQSGVMAMSPMLSEFLAGGGASVNVPSFRDLDAGNDADSEATGADRVSGPLGTNHFSLGAPTQVGSGTGVLDPVPQKIEDSQEIAFRLSRNNSWTSLDLAAALAGTDPMSAIASRVSFYWTRRLQRAFIATWRGVSADNVAVASGTDTHTQDDLVNDIAAGAFVNGVTNFTAEAFLDAAVTMGDSMEDLTACMVHSVVFNRMQKNNLIDFIPDARGEIQIPTFLGREVIVDDRMPNGTNVTRSNASGGSAEAGIYETWLFGSGAAQLGLGTPKVPTAVERKEGSGNGAGQEVLYSRQEWAIHPTGHAYIQGSVPEGGPSNANLVTAANWSRVYPERKQIKFARLVSREA